MEDAELEKIRAKRLEQLRAPYGDVSDENRKQEENEIKNNILSQVLDQSARARLNTLMIGKPEKGKMVENLILQMAQTNRIGCKITESDLIRILEDINRQTTKTTKVKFDRRRAALDDSDDDF